MHQGAAIGQAPVSSVDKHGECRLLWVAGCIAEEEMGGEALQKAGRRAGGQLAV
jgi:hypothetical protein